MKYVLTTLAFLLLFSMVSNSATKYWVGPDNGNWSNPANWSDVPEGSGGASVPGALDSVIIGQNSRKILIHVDQSPTINFLRIQAFSMEVTLYVSTPVVFTILKSLHIGPGATLVDSTSADVPFNVVFSGANHAIGDITGKWIFSGGVPVNRLAGNGARFTAEPGSQVQITQAGADRFRFPPSTVIFRNNTNFITSNPSSLRFFPGSIYILEDNADGAIPNATWAPDSSFNRSLIFFASSIRITGHMDKLTHLSQEIRYRDIVIDLPAQLTDATLNLPNGSIINGDVSIQNTNNRTLTLLAADGPNSSVSVEFTFGATDSYYAGSLSIGANAKVAMATATSSSAGTSYKLQVVNYNQTGGNFSLQDYNNTTGTSLLSVKGAFLQTGGTFSTNSSATSPLAKFVLEFVGPYSRVPTSPGSAFSWVQSIRMSGGTIDNGSHKVTLRINHLNAFASNVFSYGVTLQSPLEVGRLELVNGTLNTTDVNMLTVLDPDPVNAVIVNPANVTYVNGPLRRWTNSSSAYTFPTGKGSIPDALLADTCVIMPVSNAPSLYQAEYFRNAHPNLPVSPPLKGVSDIEYWNIEKISGADAVVILVVNAPGVPGATVNDAVVAAHYVNGTWIAEHGTVLSPGNTTAGAVLSKPLSAFGAFTFGYISDDDSHETPYSGLKYRYYEGEFSLLPDFTTLTPVKSGTSANIDLGVRTPGRNDKFAFVWEGYINIKTAGTYTFETVSDDGSKLYFNSLYNPTATATVNNDGLHAPTSATGTVNIPVPGVYPIAITFFENTLGEQMEIYWSGPGINREKIPDAAFMDTPQETFNGLEYKYYEGTWTSLPNFNTLTPVKTGLSPNIDLGVRTPGRNDNYALVWNGYINIPTPGMYTFETISDDGSKLYFNSHYDPSATATVNNDGIHAPTSATGTVNIPAAGVYPISITFFENSIGEQMEVYWKGPGIERQRIPNAAFTREQPSANGLTYRYYEGEWNTLPDFNTLTPVKTGTSANIDLGERSPGRNDRFAFVWEGLLDVPAAGNYTFETISDDGSKLYFNSLYNPSLTATVNNDGLHAPVSAMGTVYIPAAGKYPVSITFFEKDGGEEMRVYWSSETIARQQIPSSAFFKIPAQPSNGISYKYYEGSWTTLPNFNTLTPVKTGSSDNIDLGVRTPGRNDNFALLWEGYIKMPSPGAYTFETVSDDGSKLYFNSHYDPLLTATVNNDGLHAPVSATGNVTIPNAGIFPIAISFFEKDGGENMEVYWSGPGFSRQPVPGSAFVKTPPGNNFATTTTERLGSLVEDATTGVQVTRVFPNPFSGSFTIDFYNPDVSSNIAVLIYDLKGQLVHRHQAGKMPMGKSRLNVNIDGKKLPQGVYMAQLNINGKSSQMIKLFKGK